MISGKSIAKGAVVVMTATLLSRFFGFIREMVIAGQFGLTADTDAYLVAFAVPSGIAMAVAAALSAGFIPVLNNYLVRQEREEAVKVANTLLNALFVVLLVLVALAMIFAPALVRVLAPGFQGESLNLTVEMIRLMFPALIFVSLMGLASGFLHSHQHFLMPALGPIVTSLMIIGSAVALGPVMGIKGLAIGTMAGFAGQFLFQVPVMYRKGFRYRPDFALRHPGVIKVFMLMVPVLVASMAPPVMIMIERGLASNLAEGSITALNYAFRLMQLPLGLFVMAVSIPLFPALSTLASQRDFGKLKETLAKGVSVLAIIMVPAMAGLIALDVPIVRLLFERGAFKAADTIPTAAALAFYALALLPLAVRDIFRRGFYALQDTLTPVIITLSAFGINIVLDIFLIRIMGVGGIALGASLSAMAEAGVLYCLLNRRLDGLPGKEFAVLLTKLFSAALVMGAAAYLSSGFIESFTGTSSSMTRLVQVGGAMAVGVIVFFGAAIILKVREIREAADLLKGLAARAASKSRQS